MLAFTSTGSIVTAVRQTRFHNDQLELLDKSPHDVTVIYS